MANSILVADDELELIKNMSLLLQELGYEVYTATDGETTLACLKEKKPEVLILDINMPRLSGEDVLRELGKLGFKTKVIISTGYAMSDETLKERILKNFKVSAFLEKPCSIEEIDYVIKEVLKEE